MTRTLGLDTPEEATLRQQVARLEHEVQETEYRVENAARTERRRKANAKLGRPFSLPRKKNGHQPRRGPNDKRAERREAAPPF